MALPAHTRAVVTGASGGLGSAFCRELIRRGGEVVASDIDLQAVTRLARQLGEAVHPLHCDVAQLADVEKLADQAEQLLGGVDLVINNAGVAVGGAVGDIPIENWQWIMGINLWGVIHGCHVFAPRFRKQGSGHILNVASTAGLIAAPNLGPYNVTKAGVVALSETLYGELVPAGVGVSVLCPTFFQTNIGKAARLHGDPAMIEVVDKLMASSKIQADGVARVALDGAARNELYILPHRDGRLMWFIKRLGPRAFHKITPKLMAWRASRAQLQLKT